jgi:hypothetical protein
VIAKVLLSAAIVVSTAVGAAAPAGADPSVFGTLSCNCPQKVSKSGASVTDQINRGIQQGMTDLQGIQGQQ